MLRLPTNKKQTMLNGAITLVITTLIVKVIGVLYKIPLTAMLGEVGLGYFSSAYDVYTPIVSISMAGIPIAVAKMVSQDVALHRYRNARQTYRVSFRLFIIIGVVGTAVMLLLALHIAKGFTTMAADLGVTGRRVKAGFAVAGGLLAVAVLLANGAIPVLVQLGVIS